jgi:DNA mismatch repair protein MutS
MLSNPTTDCNELEKYYNMTDEFIASDSLLGQIEKNLKGIPDLERYHQKIKLNKIKPIELSLLLRNYKKIATILTFLIQAPSGHLIQLITQNDFITEFNEFNRYAFDLIDVKALKTCKIADEILEFETSFLNPGKDTVADQCATCIIQYDNLLKVIVEHLNTFLQGTRGKLIQIETESNGSISLITTEAKAKVLKRDVGLINPELCGQLNFINVNKSVMITSDKISQVCSGFQQAKVYLQKYLYDKYMKVVEHMSSSFNFYTHLSTFIAKIDFIKSNAKVAIRNKYFRPTVIPPNLTTIPLKSPSPTTSKIAHVVCNDPSFCYFENIRHPIVERIIDNEYIPNTLSLGIDKESGKDPAQGLLLYGFNGIGKSVLTKAVGMNIIMAQAGCFTPSKLIYKPYTKIITRLSGDDDIHRGHSSFRVEMTELRTILRNSDHRTLVLGDELCRGTETQSATGLTIATILHLINTKSSFIFSTHLHHLPEIQQIKDLPEKALRICHLTVTYDERTKNLIYNRKLEDGPGQSIYGIEVAKSLNLDTNFINVANKIRRELVDINDELFKTQKSRYNSKVYIDSCGICGKENTSKKGGKPLHTHHIREQKEADNNGFIDHFHKNSKFNLLVLCEECHTHIHKNGLKIESKQTPCGSFLTLSPESGSLTISN